MFIDVDRCYSMSMLIVAVTAWVCESVWVKQLAAVALAALALAVTPSALDVTVVAMLVGWSGWNPKANTLAPRDKQFQESKSNIAVEILDNSGSVIWILEISIFWIINTINSEHCSGVLLMARWNFRLQKRSKVYEASYPERMWTSQALQWSHCWICSHEPSPWNANIEWLVTARTLKLA